MKRKLTSLLMALVMTLSLAVPAFASGEDYFTLDGTASSEKEQSMTFNVKTRVPVISLTLPNISQTDAVVFNPYKIQYVVDGTDTLNGVAVADSTDQIKQVISPVYAIQNLSDAQLTVGVKATTTVPDTSKILLITTGTPDATKKQAKIDVKFVTTETTATEAQVLTQSDVEQNIDTIESTLDTANAKHSTATLTLDPKKAAEVKLTDNLILPKTNGGDDADNANYLLFQFKGSASDNPTDAWTAADTFTTVLAFTFQPGYTASAPAATGVTLTASGTVPLGSAGGSEVTSDVTVTVADTNLPTGHDLKTSAPAWTLTSPKINGTDSTTTNVSIVAASGQITIKKEALNAIARTADATITVTGTLGWDKTAGGQGSAPITITLTCASS